jgi:hypothetical protein
VRFRDQLIKTFGKLSKEVLASADATDLLARRVYDSCVARVAGQYVLWRAVGSPRTTLMQRPQPACPLPFRPLLAGEGSGGGGAAGGS